MPRRFVPLVLVLIAAAAPAQDLYRWKDATGRVHITDTPPPAGATEVQKRSQSAAPAAPAEPYAVQVARKNFPVSLYTTSSCDACENARKLLNARGVPYQDLQVEDGLDMEKLKEVAGGTAVPVLVVGSTVQRGFEEATYHRLLDAAGYPKTGILPARASPPPQSASQVSVTPAAQPEAPKTGPYAPGAPRQQRPQKK